jgi:type VI secretion system FHA domain protein
MYLTLEVVSPQAASMGEERRKVVGLKGLTIGRTPGNDWVIPDPYVSKQHARISYVNGRFVVEGLGRNPIALNNSSAHLPSGQAHPLKNGDRLFIDQYEVVISLMQGDLPGELPEDPFSPLSPQPGAAAPIPGAWDNLVPDAHADAAELDPLAALGGRSASPEPQLPPVNWQQASPLADHFEPPRPLMPAGGSIPEGWDRTGMNQRELRAGPPSARPEQRPRPAAPSSPPPRVDVRVELQAQTPTPPGRIIERRVVPRASSGSPAAVLTPRVSASSRPVESPPAPPSAGSAAYESSPSRTPPSASLGADLTELLLGAGLSDRDMSPEVVRTLGEVFRVVVQGVIDVLQARSEIKSQFRLPITRVKAAENNPLKLSPNVESALHTLLVQRNPGYLSTVQSFEDAFADIRSHQMAMLEGIRVAFEGMLNSFNPAELEKEFERAFKRSGVLGGLGGRSKYWDLYADRFESLTRDADDTFRRLFGDAFAEAYERQLERLKTLDRHNRKR